jgi:hypothetical protein
LKASIRITGDKKTMANLAAYIAVAQRSAAAQMRKEADEILFQSQAMYVPVDEDVLRQSGYVDGPTRMAKGHRTTVGYAKSGPAKAYALAVHEHLSVHSPPSWKSAEASGRGVHFQRGGPKYLELPFLKRLPFIAMRIGRVVARLSSWR